MPGQRARVLALAFASAVWSIAHAETLHGFDDGAGDSVELVDGAMHDVDDVHEGADHNDGIEQEGGEQSLSADQMHGLHKKIDANGDGKVSMAELLAFSDSTRRQILEREVQAVLEEMDRDKDGKLSIQEFLDSWGGEDVKQDEHETATMKEVEAGKFDAADTNKDGLLDIHELPAMFYPEMNEGVLDLTARQALRQKDSDGDGLLSPQEFWRDGVPSGDALGQDGQEPLIMGDEQEEFRKMDADHSGKLDLQELKAFESGRLHTEEAMKSLFELADRDKDMLVTAEELGAAREQLAGSEAHYPFVEWADHYVDDL